MCASLLQKRVCSECVCQACLKGNAKVAAFLFHVSRLRIQSGRVRAPKPKNTMKNAPMGPFAHAFSTSDKYESERGREKDAVCLLSIVFATLVDI